MIASFSSSKNVFQMCFFDQISFLSIFENVEGTYMIASLVLGKTFFKCASVIKFRS